jgi:hypothetical protein
MARPTGSGDRDAEAMRLHGRQPAHLPRRSANRKRRIDMGMVTRMSVLLKNYTLGVWVEGAGVSRNIAPWDTSDVVDEYAQADVVQVAPRSKPPCVHDPTGAARHPPESLDVFDSGLRPECANSGHSRTVQRTGQVDSLRTLSSTPRTVEMRP